MRILGIDPGVAIVGFGLIESERGSVRMLQYGAVTTPAGLPLATRTRSPSRSCFSARTSPPASPWRMAGA